MSNSSVRSDRRVVRRSTHCKKCGSAFTRITMVARHSSNRGYRYGDDDVARCEHCFKSDDRGFLGAFFGGVCEYLKGFPSILKGMRNDIVESFNETYGRKVARDLRVSSTFNTVIYNTGEKSVTYICGSRKSLLPVRRVARAIRGAESQSIRESAGMVQNEDDMQLSPSTVEFIQGLNTHGSSQLFSCANARESVATAEHSSIDNIDVSRWKGDTAFRGYHSAGDMFDARRDTAQG